MSVQGDEATRPCRACGEPVRLRKVRTRDRELAGGASTTEYERVCTNRDCPSNDTSSIGRPTC